MRRLLDGLRPSPAMVVALVALVVAMGGTSYAVISLPAKSVGTKQLKKAAVTRGKIKTNAVTGAKVKANSLTGGDIVETTLGKVPSAASADQATSATNATNATNSANADTLDGVDSTGFLASGVRVRLSTVPLADNALAFADAACLANERLTGGGGRIEANPAADLALTVSRPATAALGVPADGEVAVGWRASAFNETGGTAATTLTAFALCAG